MSATVPPQLLARAQEPGSRLATMSLDDMAEVLAAVTTPSLKIKLGMTYPPIQAYLTDNNGPYDLSTASSIEFAMKGVTLGPLVDGTAASQQVSFTATTTQSSPTLSVVSSFTDLFGPQLDGAVGSLLVGPGIPAPTLVGGLWVGTTVVALNPGASTITMSANATAGASGVSIIGNKGLAQYTLTSGNWSTINGITDTYLVEWKMTLTSPSGAILFFPSESDLNQTIEIDSTLGE